MLRTNRSPRAAFTLIELLIGMAVTVLIMSILSYCFQKSMQAMSAMRAQGDAADQLRALTTVMKRDFKADRHLPADGSAGTLNRGRRISDYQMNIAGSAGPASGFFYLESPPSTNEGNDGSFDCFRNAPNATYTFGTRIWFTSVLPGGDDANLYTATSPSIGGTVYSSEAAEIAYFLQQMPGGSNTAPFGGTVLPLFNLHRRQRLVALDSARQAALPANDPEVISTYTYTYNRPAPPPYSQIITVANTMTSLAYGDTRTAGNGDQVFTGPTRPMTLGSIFAPLSGPRAGDDIILSNVLSMEIKPMWNHQNGFRDPVPFNGRPAGGGSPAYGQNHDAPFDDLTKATNSTLLYAFDSMGQFAPAMPVRMQSMQFRIRIYDAKTKTARQVTMIVDL